MLALKSLKGLAYLGRNSPSKLVSLLPLIGTLVHFSEAFAFAILATKQVLPIPAAGMIQCCIP